MTKLEEMLLPDATDEVRARYATLAERAKTARFGLMEDEVVVLDTETTGLSFKTCELIEIAAARMSGAEVVDRFQTFVHPSAPIPPEIVQLTSITDDDVADAPSAEEAVRALAEFCDGAPVIAHNASFDRTFIERVPGGTSVSDTWLDSLALSRIALPALSSHRLQDLADAFGCAGVSHRATDDVEALCGMWRVILCALTDLPSGLLSLLAEMQPDVDWEYRAIFSHLALDAPAAEPFSLADVRRRAVSGAEAHPREDARELIGRLRCADAEEVAHAFTPEGVAGRMYAAFETRPEQLAMAEEVRTALERCEHRAIEAGTGVGKSMAYLLPLVLYARANNVTMGVATKTNALTDQLVARELPALAAALPGGVSYHSLKGFEHYPCLRKILQDTHGELPVGLAHDTGRTASAIKRDMLTAIAVCLAYASQVVEGDLDGLGIRWGSVPRSMLTSSSRECMHAKCPFFPSLCLVHGARRRAASSDVVVTNHSLLLRDVEADGNILPPIRHWVVDEAHGFESEARHQWAREVSAEGCRSAFEQLGGIRTGALHALMTHITGKEGASLPAGLITHAASCASRASLACGELFDAVRGLDGVAPRSGYDDVTLWLGDEVRQSPEWAMVLDAADVAASALEEACTRLDAANQAIAEGFPQAPSDLVEATRQVKEILSALRLVCEGTDDSYVYSASFSRARGRVGTECLTAEKIDIGAELAERWLPEMLSVCFTSATIAVGDDFSHFEQSVGLDRLGEVEARHVRLDSSFDFDNAMRVVLAGDMPDPNSRDYLRALEDLLFDVHVAMGGSVLTLFTNRREMERIFDGLKPRLAEEGLDLLCQERGIGVRRARERFLNEEQLSLLALRSFWEGFDAAGDTLRCVVIPKLPFASPNDPLARERDKREERRAWWKYAMPEAVLQVKQAAGRLIRTATDSGVLVLADSRLITKSYGRYFTESLPSRSGVVLPTSEVGDHIAEWRASR